MIEIIEYEKKLNAIIMIIKKNNQLSDKMFENYKKYNNFNKKAYYYLSVVNRLSKASQEWIDIADKLIARYK